MANLEENVLIVLRGQKEFRRREDDFKVWGTAVQPIQQRWSNLQKSISSYLAQLSAVDLDREYDHPRRGKITGRDLLIVVARHSAEHMGQAELTRDLLFTARGRPLPVRQY
jgi:hypothetical protein